MFYTFWLDRGGATFIVGGPGQEISIAPCLYLAKKKLIVSKFFSSLRFLPSRKAVAVQLWCLCWLMASSSLWKHQLKWKLWMGATNLLACLSSLIQEEFLINDRTSPALIGRLNSLKDGACHWDHVLLAF